MYPYRKPQDTRIHFRIHQNTPEYSILAGYIRIHQNTVFIENTPKSHRKHTQTPCGAPRDTGTTACMQNVPHDMLAQARSASAVRGAWGGAAAEEEEDQEEKKEEAKKEKEYSIQRFS